MIKKIELTATDTLTEEQKKLESPHKKSHKILIVLLSLFLLLVGAGVFLWFFLVTPLMKMKADAISLGNEAKKAYKEIQANNFKEAISSLSTANETLGKLDAQYSKIAWVKPLPFAGKYYRDGLHMFSAARYLLEAGDLAVVSIEPYADLLGIEGKEKKDLGVTTMEQRLTLVLDTFDKIQPNMDKIGEKLDLAKKEVDQINPNNYPEQIRGVKIREKVVMVISLVDSAAKATSEVRPIAGYLKTLLGIPQEKKYLVLFQNDAELRPTGGFWTAYALISVKNGNFKPLGSYDIYSLDAKFGNRVKPPEQIAKYLKGVYYWHLRDMNTSPDFKVSVETFWDNYKKVAPADIDGIIAVDTKLLVDILKVLGPIGVADWGNFSAENDKRCDCPQVVYELERMADKPVGIVRTDRKAVIGPLMHSILLNIMQSPRKKWPEFFNVALEDIQKKHVLMYFFDEKVQSAIESLNASGRIRAYEGDYLHINDCNFGGAKQNLFIQENVSQKMEISGDGEITKTVTIDYTNPAPASDCNLEHGELCLNAPYRNWLRVYVPKGSQLIDSSGSEVDVVTYEDLDKTVFEAFYGDKSPLRPQGKAQVSFKYKLPFKYDKNSGYRLLIQKQPGTDGYEYVVSFLGKEQTFELKTDKEIKY